MNRRVDRNVLLTGIPRSGTTLLTALLDCPPTTVAIGEPQGLGALQKQYANDHSGFVQNLKKYFFDMRGVISNKKPFKDRKSVNGKPLTNYVEGGGGQRTKSYQIADRQVDYVEKDFHLVIKAPVIFTAILPTILADKSYKVIAIIRNPISTILSWNSIEFPISKGRLPAGEGYWPELGEVTGATYSIVEKQARIWELFARRYIEHQSEITLLKYEDVVYNPKAVSDMLSMPFSNIEIENMNNNPVYDSSIVSNIKESLLEHSPSARLLYP
jgi:hypothetical protein